MRTLIFNKNLSRKKSFNGIVAAATGEDIGEPEYVKPDYSDIRVNFDDETLPSVFSVRGDGSLTVQRIIRRIKSRSSTCFFMRKTRSDQSDDKI